MTARLSRRATQVRPLRLASLLAEAAGGDVIDLALGVPPDTPPAPVVDGAVRALRAGHHQYIGAAGLPELRRLVAADLAARRGVPVDPDTEVTITCGSTEGAMIALLAVTDPGDEVLVVEPYFENHPGAVELAGAVPRYVRLTGPGWRLEPEALRAAVTPRTRAVLLSNPHNPTGRCFDRHEMDGLLAVCREHGLVCLTDEVYEHYVYDGRTHVSPLGRSSWCPGTRGVVLGSLSKSIQVSGWRVGYCVADPELTEGLRRVQTRTTLGASTPLQHGLAEGLAHGATPDAGWRPRFERRRDRVTAELRDMGFEVTAPDGGWFVMAGTAPLGRCSVELARRLVAEAGVLVAPGTAFFLDADAGRRWMRVTLTRDEETTARGLGRLRDFLESSSNTPRDAVGVGSAR